MANSPATSTTGWLLRLTSVASLCIIFAVGNLSPNHRRERIHSRHRQALLQVNRTTSRPWASFCAPGAGWKPEWADEFDGDTLNQATWQVVTTEDDENPGGVSAPVAGLPVTACRTAKCRASNVQVRGGQLHLLSERDPQDKYFTGAVTTKGRRAWKDDKPYRLCVSAKLPGGGGLGRGVWPAHWMLPDNNISDRCLDEGEMDIMEMINGDGGAYSTFHWMSSWPKQKCASFDQYHRSQARLQHMPSDWSDAFHEYAVERSADTIRFAVDGEVVNTVDKSRIGEELSHSPFFLILNTAVGGGWPGEPTSHTKMPTEHVIDYVRVVRKSGEEAAGTDRRKSWPQKGVGMALQPSSFVQMAVSTIAESPPPLSLPDLSRGPRPRQRA